MGRNAAEIRDALDEGELDAAFLVNADPVRDPPDGPAWTEALGKADFVLAISMFEDASTKHADVVFPAESYAEKEGTVTHPDGRLQRVRPGVPHPGRARPIWEVLAELSALLGDETGHRLGAGGAGGDRLRGPLLRRDHPRGDRRPRSEMAGAGRGRELPAGSSGPGRLSAEVPTVLPTRGRPIRRRRTRSRRTAASDSAPTATSGPRR